MTIPPLLFDIVVTPTGELRGLLYRMPHGQLDPLLLIELPDWSTFFKAFPIGLSRRTAPAVAIEAAQHWRVILEDTLLWKTPRQQ